MHKIVHGGVEHIYYRALGRLEPSRGPGHIAQGDPYLWVFATER